MLERTATMPTPSDDAERRIYPRPPIVEAIIELRYEGEVAPELVLDALRDALGTYNGDPRKQERIQFEAQVSGDTVQSLTKKLPDLTFLRTTDGLRQIGVAPGGISVHVLAPYPGWERFLEQAHAAVQALPDVVRTGPVTALGVRYIDRITLPDSNVQRFLKVMPYRPTAMPTELTGFHVVTQTTDPTDGTLALLTIATGPPEADGKPSLIYDLNVRRVSDHLCTFADDAWIPIIEALHKRQREIFEDSITDDLRELFQ